MWYRPTYNSYMPYNYTPHAYGYSSFGDAVPRDRAARESEAAARRRAGLPRWQDPGLSSRNSYLSEDDDDGSFIPYPYDPRPRSYPPHAEEDLGLRQSLEQQRQLQLAHQAESNRRREAERARGLAEYGYRSQAPQPTAHRVPISTSSPEVSPSPSPDPEPAQLPKYPISPKLATPEEIRAAMTIQEFYRRRLARKQALAAIDELSAQFERFKPTFSPPPHLDYRGPTPDNPINIAIPFELSHTPSTPPSSENNEDTTEITKSGPALAFTSNNNVVHEYIENLNRLLVELDRIESGGDTSVREQRKQMIRNVEAEAQRMDRWIAAVWDLAQP